MGELIYLDKRHANEPSRAERALFAITERKASITREMGRIRKIRIKAKAFRKTDNRRIEDVEKSFVTLLVWLRELGDEMNNSRHLRVLEKNYCDLANKFVRLRRKLAGRYLR